MRSEPPFASRVRRWIRDRIRETAAAVNRDETWQETAAFWSFRRIECAALTLPEEIGRRVFIAGGGVAWRRMRRVRATAWDDVVARLMIALDDVVSAARRDLARRAHDAPSPRPYAPVRRPAAPRPCAAPLAETASGRPGPGAPRG